MCAGDEVKPGNLVQNDLGMSARLKAAFEGLGISKTILPVPGGPQKRAWLRRPILGCGFGTREKASIQNVFKRKNWGIPWQPSG